MMITRFFFAPVLNALLPFQFQIKIVCIHGLLDIGVGSAEDTSSVGGVINFAVFTGPLWWAIASVIAKKIFANSVRLLARITCALIPGIYLAMRSCRSKGTVTSISNFCLGYSASTAIQARFSVAIRTCEFAVVPVIIVRAKARVSGLFRGTNTPILTRRAVAEVHFYLAVPSHVSRLAIAMVIVDQLHAILSSWRGARIGQTLVYVAFAFRSYESWRAFAFESANLIGARSVVVTSADRTIVHVELAYKTQGSRGARATEVADKIVTRTAILAGIRLAIVHVKLAILSLETFGTLALIRSNKILAGGSILTGGGIALVYLFLTVRARVPFQTMTTVAVAYVLASAIVAKIFLGHSLPYSRILARNHLYVADFTGPTGGTIALILVLLLDTSSPIFARIIRTPVDVLVASSPGITVGTVTGVILNVIVTSGTIEAGQTVAFVDTILTIRTCVARFANACIIVDTVYAFTTVHATTVRTILVIRLTIYTGKSELTLAGVRVHVFFTYSTILTRLR